MGPWELEGHYETQELEALGHLTQFFLAELKQTNVIYVVLNKKNTTARLKVIFQGGLDL